MALDFKTYQEITLQGGTLNEEEKPSNPYIPLGVARGTLSIEEAQKLRKETGHFSSIPLQGALELPFDEIAVSYEDLDPVTGETIADPKVLGILNRLGKEIIPVAGRDLNTEAREKIKKWEEDDPTIQYFLREEPPQVNKEQEGSGSIESE
ncbi:hypothetical protein HYU95_01025 [Candidatus Daviesbacteria bacterium]|nr:hypothetical protein [Candidatus Daviesbacteria bacterium]